MNAYLEKLKAYVEAHPIQFGDDCDFPALDSLYWHYSECHNMSNEKIITTTKCLIWEGDRFLLLHK